jgi:hypothetical protein
VKLDLTTILPAALRPYAKLVYAVLGALVVLTADGTLTGTFAHVVTAVASVLTPAAVYQADNRPAETEAADTEQAAPAADIYPDDMPVDEPVTEGVEGGGGL